MKYYLKIEDFEFSNVSKMEIIGVYRKESVQQNLAGGYLVDRIGKEKLTINAKLNLLNTTEMYRLRQARDRIFNNVEFDRGGVRTSAIMRLHEFTEPSPLHISPFELPTGEISYSIVYANLEITLEEA